MPGRRVNIAWNLNKYAGRFKAKNMMIHSATVDTIAPMLITMHHTNIV